MAKIFGRLRFDCGLCNYFGNSRHPELDPLLWQKLTGHANISNSANTRGRARSLSNKHIPQQSGWRRRSVFSQRPHRAAGFRTLQKVFTVKGFGTSKSAAACLLKSPSMGNASSRLSPHYPSTILVLSHHYPRRRSESNVTI